MREEAMRTEWLLDAAEYGARFSTWVLQKTARFPCAQEEEWKVMLGTWECPVRAFVDSRGLLYKKGTVG